MKNIVSSFVVGLIFSTGLILSGMTNPQKIIGFLDITGNWDPTLIFVMIGAISVHSATYRTIRKRSSPILSNRWLITDRKEITGALLIGSFIFGIGWGLGGYCPGPAITAISSLRFSSFLFVISMLFGMALFTLIDRKLKIRR